MMTSTTFGEAVRRLRIAHKLTQTQLAGLGDLSRTQLARIERGQVGATRMRTHGLAIAFGFAHGMELIAAAEQLGPDIATRPTTCAGCSAPLVQPARAGRPRRFCTQCGTKAAMNERWRAENSGKIADYNAARRLPPHQLRCRHCDRAFQAKRRDTTYCTARCKSLAKWQRERAARAAAGAVVAPRPQTT